MAEKIVENPTRRPNLLLVITDQQRADTVAADSPCETPSVRALAEAGATFERCYAVAPTCSPSRASLFTGLLPHSHGVTDVTHAVPAPLAQLREDAKTWTQQVAAAGYRTGYYGKWHVERSDELERFGFAEYETELSLVGVKEKPAGAEDGLVSSLTVKHPGYKDLPVAGVTRSTGAETREAALVTKGVDFIERAEADEPWFLTVSLEAPHDPYLAPEEHFSQYDPSAVRPPVSFDDPMRDKPAVYRRIRDSLGQLDWDDFAYVTACYHARCSMVDEQVGRLLKALERTGQTEDTLVVFTSDHGDYMGAHGLLFKGVPAFEEAYRVPLVMRGPGVKEGVTSGRPVSLLDLPRTLVRLVLGEEFDCQGGDLTPLLSGEELPGDGEAFAEFHGQRLGYTQRVLWHGSSKYVFNGFDEDELYDLAADPHELTNLASNPRHRAQYEAMARRMWRWVNETGDATLADAHYGMFRFAPVGPNAADR